MEIKVKINRQSTFELHKIAKPQFEIQWHKKYDLYA